MVLSTSTPSTPHGVISALTCHALPDEESYFNGDDEEDEDEGIASSPPPHQQKCKIYIYALDTIPCLPDATNAGTSISGIGNVYSRDLIIHTVIL